jgi:glycosyl transferase family 1
MRIAQVILPAASEYERKSQRLDQSGLASKHEVVVVEPDALRHTATDVVHFYGNDLAVKLIKGLRRPFIASAEPHVGPLTFTFRRPPQPRYIVSPIAPIDPDARVQLLPEAVDDSYFGIRDSGLGAENRIPNPQSPIPTIGTFGAHRIGVSNMIEQTLVRLHRTREDVRWSLFDAAPTPDDLRAVDVWVDPATSESDFDGFVAEASAAGKAVVASRTTINSQRLEKGRTGFLVPPRDPNELAHAILTALFRSEAAKLKIEAAKQTAGKFRARQRLRVLERIYETLVQ